MSGRLSLFSVAISTSAILVGAYFFLSKSPAKPAPGQCLNCNVVLISVDSLRRDHMSLYGYKRETTPRISAWAQKAMVFSNYMASAYLTPISEGSVHTGLYPEVSGLTSFRRPMSSDVRTMAQILKEQGYRTAAVGTSPEFVNFEAVRQSFERGFDSYRITPTRLSNNRTPYWPAIRKLFQESKRTPFFLWFNLGDVHAPFGVMAENLFADEKYKGPFQEMKFYTNLQFYYDGWVYNPLDPLRNFQLIAWRDEKQIDIHSASKDWARSVKWPLRVTRTDLDYMIDIYDNGVLEADREVGRLLTMIQEFELENDTVIILQAEHGESLGERGYIAHYDIHDESVHVPLVISSPALRSAKSDILLSGIDILPTLLHHLRLKPNLPYELDGRSFLTDGGEPTGGRDEVFLTRTPLWESIIRAEGGNRIFDRFRALDDQIGFKDHAIRTKTEKLIHRTARAAEEQFSCWAFVSGKTLVREEFEYYDLLADPDEKRPLKPAGKQFSKLASRLEKWKAEISTKIRKTPVTPLVQDYQ